jgi:glycosyltransferase involved in cell wall biosynthesis
LFFLPTRHETFLVSAAEAIGAGRPVVVGGNGGPKDFVDDSNGILVGEQSVEAYTNAICQMYERLQAGDFDAQVLSESIQQRFSADAVGELFEQAYALAKDNFASRHSAQLLGRSWRHRP